MKKTKNRKFPGVFLPGRMMRTMKLMTLLLVLQTFQVTAKGYSQENITLKMKNVTFAEVVKEIERQSKVTFLYNHDYVRELDRLNPDYSNLNLQEVLDHILTGTNLEYKLIDNTVVITAKQGQDQFEQEIQTIKGKVVDVQGHTLPGVTVVIKGTNLGVATDMDGRFSIQVPRGKAVVLVCTFVGMRKKEVNYVEGKELTIVMEEEAAEMDEVIVTGYFQKSKESFTGSEVTINTEELKKVGALNMIQALNAFDPSIRLNESLTQGSNPNVIPDITIRGENGFDLRANADDATTNPNAPLYILDGVEVSAERIYDMDLNRVESTTILKDASATALYGSRGANGVIVITTIRPKVGQIRINLNANYNVSIPDLRDYNLMNAAEKLEFERLAGNFKSNIADYQELKEVRYNKLLSNVLRGVDTYWLSEPIRIGFNQRHNLYVEGGSEQFRYGFGGSYNKIQGVMKSSTRDIFSGNLDLLYRVGKLTFSNKLSVDVTKHDNPVVPFSEYAHANPYYPKRTADGAVEKWLEYKEDEMSATDASEIVGNPLWNAALNSYDKSEMFGVRNNFNLEYRPFDFLYIRGRFGISKQTTDSERFTSPDATEFDQVELLKKGSYDDMREDDFSYDGDLTLTYGQIFNDAHQINAVLGVSISERKSISKGFSAVGFPEGNFTTPGFSNEYPDNGKPSYGDSKNRSANFYFNGGYSYKNKYLLDANVRMDGTSVFGSNKKFTTTWAVGVAWNIHNEYFIKDNTDIFDMLKVRTSIGNPGNQNFGSYNTITTYQYNNWMQNNFGTGLLVSTFGDPDLQWQKTTDINVGFDLSMWSRFHINFDYFHKNTDPLLASIGISSSVGMSSRLSNIGKQVNKGVSGTIRYAIIYRPQERINWTMSLSFRNVKTYYDKIGRKLNQYNKQNISKNLTRYYDGGSPTALWAVRSAGIDPATGQEIFIKKDGSYTFSYDVKDKVALGNTIPYLEGAMTTSVGYKGFSISAAMSFTFGGDIYNATRASKVERINPQENVDVRAFTERWKKPGDVVHYTALTDTKTYVHTQRFIEKKNEVALSSLNISYEFKREWVKKIGLNKLRIGIGFSDVLRISTVKYERGTTYPYSKGYNFTISPTF